MLLGIGHGIVDDRWEGEGIGKPEVRDRLTRGDDGELDLDAGEEASGPGPGGDDTGVCRDLVPVGADPNGAPAVLDPGDATMVEDDGTGVDGGVEQRLVRPVGEGRAAVGLEEHLLGRLGGDRPAVGHLRAREKLVADAARGERARVLGRNGPKSRPPVCTINCSPHSASSSFQLSSAPWASRT